MPNPAWTRDELILALDLYFREPSSRGSKTHPAVIELSELLNRLPIQADDLGHGFAECHHTKPLAELQPGQKTTLKDLAIVCANCHRMLHRGKRWLAAEKFCSAIETA